MAIFLPHREGLLVQLSGIGRRLQRHQADSSIGQHPCRRQPKSAFGVFYKFSTLQVPRANGFSLTTGISTLSCQVNGMDLDYSGPRKTFDEDAPTASIPSQEKTPQAQLR